MEDIEPTVIAPPPWRLTGRGLVLLYCVPRGFNERYGFMEPYQGKGYIGGVGTAMLVEYQTTAVGPYLELLYMPGLFYLGGKLAFSISRIYVSTHDSAWNGRENWGIAKELADFTCVQRPNGELAYEVEANGQVFLSASAKPWGPELPLPNKYLGVPRIVQRFQGQLLLTRPIVSGHMRLATLQHMHADSAFFPPLQQLRPLATLSLSDFQMTFPPPEIL